jgi:anti-sigma factor RsiW
MTKPDRGPDLDSYLDGELSDTEQAAFERELERSAELRRALESRGQLDRAIRSMATVEPSPQFEAQFWARLVRAEEPLGWRRGLARLRAWGPVMAAPGLASVLLVLLMGNPSLPERDWELLADPVGFELMLSEDVELVKALDVVEAWDGTEAL